MMVDPVLVDFCRWSMLSSVFVAVVSAIDDESMDEEVGGVVETSIYEKFCFYRRLDIDSRLAVSVRGSAAQTIQSD